MVNIRFSIKQFLPRWQRVEKGIITGYTLNVVPFASTMPWLLESVNEVTKGSLTSSGQRQAYSRLFVDDIATTT